MSTNATTISVAGNYKAVKRVALVYLAFAFFIFVIMGVIGSLMRLQQGGVVSVMPELFYPLMTLHGIGMVSAALLAAIGGFAAVLSKSVSVNTRWLWTVFVIYFMGMMFVLIATLVGGFAAAWTALYPLPFHGTWSLWAALSATIGVGFVAVALLIYFPLIMISTSKAYGGLRKALAWKYISSGGRNTSGPLPKPVEILGVAVSIPGIICVVTGFIWLVPLWIQAAGLVQGIDVLFSKNFDYFFGHLLANLTIYFAAALMYFTLPLYTKREWKTTWSTALALNSVIILLLVPYPHHLYQDFAQPLPLSALGEIGSYLSTIPVLLVTILGGLSQIYRSGIRWSVTPILIGLGLWGWAFGGIGGVLDATIAVNQIMHNTLWVPAHFHTYFVIGALAFTWAYLYHLVHEPNHSSENPRIKFAAALYGIGGAGFVLMFFLSGAFSIPRRYAEYLPQWQIFARIAVFPFIILLAIGVLWLGYEIFSNLKSAWNQKEPYADVAKK